MKPISSSGSRLTRDGRQRCALLLVCYAEMVQIGNLYPFGLVLLSIAIVLMLSTRYAPRAKPVRALWWEVTVAVLLLMMLDYPRNVPEVFDSRFVGPLIAVSIAGALGALILRRRRLTAVALMGVLGLAQMAMIVVTLARTWGAAPIDVFAVQQEGARALLRGINPYTPLIDQLVGPGGNPSAFRAVAQHFPYGPSIAVLDMPSRLLGDVRLTHVAAFGLLLAVLMTFARRDGSGQESRIAVLWLAFPLTLGMVENSWIDIVTMAGLGGWLVLRGGHPRWAMAVLAIALAAKPIFLPALIPLFVWSGRCRREILLAGLMAAVIILPFAIATGFGQFYADVVETHAGSGPRYDSLTISAYLHLTGHAELPLLALGAVIAATSLVCVVRRPRDQADALTAGAAICTIGFLMSQHAFFNYYYIPAVLLVMALAAGRLPIDSRAEATAASDEVDALSTAAGSASPRRGPAAPSAG